MKSLNAQRIVLRRRHLVLPMMAGLMLAGLAVPLTAEATCAVKKPIGLCSSGGQYDQAISLGCCGAETSTCKATNDQEWVCRKSKSPLSPFFFNPAAGGSYGKLTDSKYAISDTACAVRVPHAKLTNSELSQLLAGTERAPTATSGSTKSLAAVGGDQAAVLPQASLATALPPPANAVDGDFATVEKTPITLGQAQPRTPIYQLKDGTPVYEVTTDQGEKIFAVSGYPSVSGQATQYGTDGKPQVEYRKLIMETKDGVQRQISGPQVSAVNAGNLDFNSARLITQTAPASRDVDVRPKSQTAGVDPTTKAPELRFTVDEATGNRVYRKGETEIVTDTQGHLQNAENLQLQLHENKYNRDNLSKAGSKDTCSTSAGFNSSYGCNGVASVAEISRGTNQATQAAGSIALQVMGQKAAIDAQRQGTQSGAYAAAAAQGELTAKYAMGVGAVNAAFALVQNSQRSKHGKYEKQLKTGGTDDITVKSGIVTTSSNTSDNAKIVQKSGLYSVRHTIRNEGAMSLDAQTKAELQIQKDQATQEYVRGQVSRIRSSASNEQHSAAQDAKRGMMTSAILAAKGLMEGAMGLRVAKQMKDVAKQVQGIENKGGILPGFTGGVTADPETAQQGTGSTISGNGETTEAAATDDSKVDETIGDLGAPPFANETAKTPKESIAPGNFQAKEGGSAGGGGGGSFGGGSATQAAKDDSSSEAAAHYADNKSNPTSYGAAGAQMGPTNGAAKPSGGGDSGVDLNSLLAQFLPKSPEEGANPQSIMDFAGGRAPASDEPQSLLGRNVNLFERISKTYSDKAQRGYVGL